MALAGWALLPAGHALAATQTLEVGSITFVRGVATARLPGAAPRILGRNSPIYETDLIETGKRSFALLRLDDDTRMTLRPLTRFEVARFRYREPAGSGLLRLLRGGFRAVTGLLSKRSAKSLRVFTPVATIGIRGTEFDARLCARDCAAELPGGARSIAPARSPVTARVVLLHGRLHATGWAGKRRRLFAGGPVYQGDTLDTGKRDSAVIAFRDGTRITLEPDTRFQVERYDFARAQPQTGSAFMRLLRGGLRAVTGLLAKRRRTFFRLVTPVATIGIRGTGFDLSCRGKCAEAASAVDLGDETTGPGQSMAATTAAACRPTDDFHAYVWSGAVSLQTEAGVFALGTEQAACMTAPSAPPALLSEVPAFMRDNPNPRPDGIEVDLPQLFDARAQVEGAQPGLYVTVEEGDVLLGMAGRTVHIAGGESGYANAERDELFRSAAMPWFIDNDPYPRPGEVDETRSGALPFAGSGSQPGAPADMPQACTL